MTGSLRVGKLIALASEINDVEIDTGSLAFMGQALVQTVKQRAKLSRLGVETASNSFHLSM